MNTVIIKLAAVVAVVLAAATSRAQSDAPILTERDVPYAANENPRQRLDLLLPSKRSSAKLPVIVFIHGGAWRQGDKRGGHGRLRPFVQSGEYAGVSVGYRLSGEAQWPAQIHDCKAAIRWIRAHADKYKLNADRIGVWGTSAGGHLVAMLGTSGEVDEMEGEVGPHRDQSSRVTCVVDFFGPTDFLRMNRTAFKGATLDHDAAGSPESRLIGGPIQRNKEKVATANPITYVTADDPPFLIAHGTNDRLVSFNQSELLRDALRKSKSHVTLIRVEGGGHGWRTKDVHPVVRRFFADHLQGVKAEWKDQTVKETGARRSRRQRN